MTQQDPLTVYYDGACPLCRAEISHYQSLDGADAICFRNVASADVELPDQLTREAALARFHISRADGTLVSGAEAFVTLWESLPQWRFLARLARLPGVLTLLEIGYRGTLIIRPTLSRWFARWQARHD
jgi:predicted DCC family thiol-disulfide oxidoreductase YuxK